MTSAAVHIQDLCFNYEAEAEVLKDISFSVQQGERVALLGQNGAGKTTLVKHLNGLLRPKQGSVTILVLRSTNKSV